MSGESDQGQRVEGPSLPYYWSGVIDCKHLMKKFQNLMTTDPEYFDDEQEDSKVEALSTEEGRGKKKKRRRDAYDTELINLTDKWDKADCSHYKKRWEKRCNKCRDILDDPWVEDPPTSDTEFWAECEKFQSNSCQYTDSQIPAELFVSYDTELEGINNILCQPGSILGKKQIDFYLKKENVLNMWGVGLPRWKEHSKKVFDLMDKPNVCLGIATSPTILLSVLSLFFTYRLLPVLYRFKTMALIPTVRFKPLKLSAVNIKNDRSDALRMIKSHQYPILSSWKPKFHPMSEGHLWIKFEDRKNLDRWIMAKNIHPFPLIIQEEKEPEQSQLECGGDYDSNLKRYIRNFRTFEWNDSDSDSDLRDKFILSPTLKSEALKSEAKFNLRNWFVEQIREDALRESIMEDCIDDFCNLYQKTKDLFPDYLKYNINLSWPRHALAAIFDEQEKRVLYFNSHGQSDKAQNKSNFDQIIILNFLYRVITKLNSTGDRSAEEEPGWKLSCSRQNLQKLSGSCGLHSLFFFWYGCCNSYQTITNFWNLNLSPERKSEGFRRIESSSSIKMSQSQIPYIFIEVLVNQISEMTRFLLKRCMEKCKHSDGIFEVEEDITLSQMKKKLTSLLRTLMRCDLSQLELGAQIQQLMPAAQFFVRVFGLKLGRVSLPQPLLEKIRRQPLLKDIRREKDMTWERKLGRSLSPAPRGARDDALFGPPSAVQPVKPAPPLHQSIIL